MGLLDRLWRLIRANLTSLIDKAEDPEKILEQTVIDMQDDLIRLRQSVAQAIATQKRTERQQSQAQLTAQEWQQRAQLALQKGDENLAREALVRKASYQETATALHTQLDQQRGIVDQMKQNMVLLERKLAEAKTKKDMYIARARSAQASQQLNEMLGQAGNSGAIAAFERMEEKVLQLEAQSEAIAELSNNTVEQRFAALESSDVDEELAAMKAQLSSPAPALPQAEDEEMRRLRSQLEEG
ncbi:MAG: PspA/IM30 family protein [Leptolyngbyaceae cyanobacterium SM1_3_5]|nr:PspA/IM30 family protein [Leptolyngbyaceae cyanobacterium SM1_3_5]